MPILIEMNRYVSQTVGHGQHSDGQQRSFKVDREMFRNEFNRF